jgi:hypothetical protein
VELDQNDNEESETLFNDENNSPSEANSESVDYVSDNVDSTSTGKTHRVATPVAVDAAQQEAIAVLKKLKVCFEKLALELSLSCPALIMNMLLVIKLFRYMKMI